MGIRLSSRADLQHLVATDLNAYRRVLGTLSMVALVGIATAAAAEARKNEPIQPIPAPEIKDPAKVALGKQLFFDPRLSKSGFISCNSCHNVMRGGADNLPSSVGHGWQLGPINSPTVFNAKYNVAQFWDGRAKDLKEQAGGPIANPGEMASTHGLAVKTLKSIPGYVDAFKKVYGAITIDNVQDAIAAYEETLVTPNSPFDKWLAGDDKALSAKATEGYKLFKTKGCVGCHNGPAVGGTSFQKLGVVKPFPRELKNPGRFAVTGKESDRFSYKVPTLRNVARTYPYFHTGHVWDLGEAVEIMALTQLGQTLKPGETEAIVAFLNALTGELPDMTMPRLPPSAPDTPRPVLAQDNQSAGAAHP